MVMSPSKPLRAAAAGRSRPGAVAAGLLETGGPFPLAELEQSRDALRRGGRARGRAVERVHGEDECRDDRQPDEKSTE